MTYRRQREQKAKLNRVSVQWQILIECRKERHPETAGEYNFQRKHLKMG